MIEFKRPELTDRELIQGYYDSYPSRSCERCFANNYLWSVQEETAFAVVEGTLVFDSVYRGKTYFSWPAGPENKVVEAIEALDRYACDKLDQDLRFYHLTPSFFERLESLEPGRWQIVYDRDMADYIYEREKLSSLSGKKLHGKRNHINRFVEQNPDWHYEPISADNACDAEKVALRWRRENGCDEDPAKRIESCIALRAIELFDDLKLEGGILYTGIEPVAFTLGEPLCDDTFVIHIEKAVDGVQGAYPMINREFVRHACEDYTYVNREEDTGAEGLRRAKMSYRPAFLEEKGIAARS